METSPLILIVDDDANDVLLFQRALRKIRPGTDTAVARDGDEAVRRLAGEGVFSDRSRHRTPTNVVLDLKLPRRSGLEVLDWIRSSPTFRDLRVVVLSSSREPSDIARAHRAGVDRYCVKPAGSKDLEEAVRGILDGWGLLA